MSRTGRVSRQGSPLDLLGLPGPTNAADALLHRAADRCSLTSFLRLTIPRSSVVVSELNSDLTSGSTFAIEIVP